MLRTDVIYLVQESPTSHCYHYSPNGTSTRIYGSAKRARLIEGDLPIVSVPAAEFFQS